MESLEKLTLVQVRQPNKKIILMLLILFVQYRKRLILLNFFLHSLKTTIRMQRLEHSKTL